MVRSPRGFSLIEVMIVIAILGVLAAIAAPNAVEWIASQKVRDIADSLHMSLLRARNEAMTRGVEVSITATSGSTDWSTGWSVADSASATARFDVQQTVDNSYIKLAQGNNPVRFLPTGRLVGSETAFWIAVKGTAMARCIEISLNGKPKIRAIYADWSSNPPDFKLTSSAASSTSDPCD